MAEYLGKYIIPDEWRFGELLIESDWEAAQYRLPSTGGDLAVNIRPTGKIRRAYVRNYGQAWSAQRVEIEFVGDGYPSTFTRGWLVH